jgi:hypothetical protein
MTCSRYESDQASLSSFNMSSYRCIYSRYDQ